MTFSISLRSVLPYHNVTVSIENQSIDLGLMTPTELRTLAAEVSDMAEELAMAAEAGE